MSYLNAVGQDPDTYLILFVTDLHIYEMCTVELITLSGISVGLDFCWFDTPADIQRVISQLQDGFKYVSGLDCNSNTRDYLLDYTLSSSETKGE